MAERHIARARPAEALAVDVHLEPEPVGRGVDRIGQKRGTGRAVAGAASASQAATIAR